MSGFRACSARPFTRASARGGRLVLIHLTMTRTAFGLKLQVLGANRAAAVHAGDSHGTPDRPAFVLSAGLIGFGGAVEVLGVWGTVRADWNPALGCWSFRWCSSRASTAMR